MLPEILIHIYMYLFCREVQVKTRKASVLSGPASTSDAESSGMLVTPGVSDILERVKRVCALVLIRVHLRTLTHLNWKLKLALYTHNKLKYFWLKIPGQMWSKTSSKYTCQHPCANDSTLRIYISTLPNASSMHKKGKTFTHIQIKEDWAIKPYTLLGK